MPPKYIYHLVKNRIDSRTNRTHSNTKSNALQHTSKSAQIPANTRREENQMWAKIDCLRYNIKLLMLSNYNCIQFITCNTSTHWKWWPGQDVRMGGKHITKIEWWQQPKNRKPLSLNTSQVEIVDLQIDSGNSATLSPMFRHNYCYR